MKKLISGLKNFKKKVFKADMSHFQTLEKGQNPKVMFITCSDSRIAPGLLLNTKPGEVFQVRNAGNIVPKYGATDCGVSATVEMAVAKLSLEEIIICGHSDCGAMTLLVNPKKLESLPETKKWLKFSRGAEKASVKEKGMPVVNEVFTAVAKNVLIQLKNLRSYPTITERLKKGELKLHGWVYKIDTGDVFEYRDRGKRWVPLN